jgi:hypothetical protein
VKRDDAGRPGRDDFTHRLDAKHHFAGIWRRTPIFAGRSLPLRSASTRLDRCTALVSPRGFRTVWTASPIFHVTHHTEDRAALHGRARRGFLTGCLQVYRAPEVAIGQPAVATQSGDSL